VLCHWHHLANTIKPVLPLAQPSPQPKWQVDHFSCFCAANGSVLRHTGVTWQIQLNLCFLGPPESTIHTANRLVQPFLHSSRQKVPILYNGGPFSPKLLLPTGIWTPSNLRFLGPVRAHNPNGITIGSAVFAQMTAMGCPFSLKIAPSHGGCGPHLIHGSLGLPESFGSLVIASHGLPPVTAGIGVWLDGVGQAGMYHTAERMNGRTAS